VDFLQKVERPAVALPDPDAYGELLERFHSRRYIERERFAHSYAERLSGCLLASNVIPFDRQINREQIVKDRLCLDDFGLSEDC
jgi:hypothetical protein